MAEIVRYVDPDATGGGTGVDFANAYTSLSAWEAAEQQDLTDAGGDTMVVNCQSSSGTADSTFLDIAGWTTSAAFNITINGDNDTGKWDVTKHRLDVSDGNAFIIHEDFVDLNQFYCKVTGATAARYVFQASSLGAGATINMDKCFFDGDDNVNTYFFPNDSDLTWTLTNSIITGCKRSFFGVRIGASTATTWLNVTSYNNYYGFRVDSGTEVMKNCVIFNCNDDINTSPTMTNCATDDGDNSGSDGNITITQSADDWAALVTDAAGGDFSVTDTSSELYNAGTNTGAPSDDLIGTSRPQATTVDIGAFELIVAAGGTITTSLDALLNKSGITKNVLLDALLTQSGISQNLTLDALVNATLTKTVTLDALIKKTLTEITTLDALINKTGITQTTDLDALLNKSSIFQTTDLDALLQKLYTKTTTLDALINKSDNIIDTTLDAILFAGNTVTATLDALINKSGLTQTTTLDALIKKSGLIQALTLDALISKTKAIITTLDAVLILATTKTVTLDALLTAQGLTRSTTLDAVLILVGQIPITRYDFFSTVEKPTFVSQLEKPTFETTIEKPTFKVVL